ncbi:MAG TPA: protoglobin domain-containing protein [Kofleriaceae bacterium]|jgi:rsbT co-antagonist protein RsbR|nr:protoglobin domain-containing protein [Kofleriaceae bacterium]
MQNVGITDAEMDRRKQFVGLGPDDLARLAVSKPVIVKNVDQLTDTFFKHLAGIQEAKVLLGYPELTRQARELKRAHLIEMTEGKYDIGYAQQRIKLALLYGNVGLETKVFVGAFQHVLGRAGELLLADSPEQGFQRYLSLQKVAVLDIGLHSDVLIHERQRIIGRQSEAIRELSTPVLQVRERLLLLPLIGVIDTHRAKLITENILRAVRDARAKVVVMDVTGVTTIDSKVANHLVQTVTAARLMGAQTIVTGVTADVAQSMVALGIEMTPFKTVGDLQGGLEYAEQILGYQFTRVEG